MSSSEVLLLAFLIGVIAGLRALTAPAVVAYGAHKSWLHLRDENPVDGRVVGADLLRAARYRRVDYGSAAIDLAAHERSWLDCADTDGRTCGSMRRRCWRGFVAAWRDSGNCGSACWNIWRLSGSNGTCASVEGSRLCGCLCGRFGGDLRWAFHRFAILRAGKIGDCCKSQAPFYRRLENGKLLILKHLREYLIALP